MTMIEIQKLSKLRESWEKGSNVLLTVPVRIGTFRKLYVITQNRSKEYNAPDCRLKRYFQMPNGQWEVSVDLVSTLEYCIERINKDQDVKDAVANLDEE